MKDLLNILIKTIIASVCIINIGILFGYGFKIGYEDKNRIENCQSPNISEKQKGS